MIELDFPGGARDVVTARRSLYQYYHSGIAEDAPPYVARKVDYAELRRAPAGADIWIVDGRLERITEQNEYPVVTGTNVGGAEFHITNSVYRPRSSFMVRRSGETSHGTPEYTTRVDGDLVYTGEFRPNHIKWPSDLSDEAGNSGLLGGLGFGGGL